MNSAIGSSDTGNTMITTLKLIALAVIGGVIVLVLGLGLLIWFVRRWLRRAIEADRVLPCRVTLEPETKPQWRNAGKVNKLIDELRALGFRDVGSFQVPELGGLLLHGLFHPQEPCYGLVYDHKEMGPTMEIEREFADHTSVNATNTAIAKTLDQRPDAKTHWLGDVPAQQLFDTVKTHIAAAP